MISQPVPQVIDEVYASANVQEFSLIVDSQTNSHASIQQDQSVQVCNVETNHCRCTTYRGKALHLCQLWEINQLQVFLFIENIMKMKLVRQMSL